MVYIHSKNIFCVGIYWDHESYIPIVDQNGLTLTQTNRFRYELGGTFASTEENKC